MKIQDPIARNECKAGPCSPSPLSLPYFSSAPHPATGTLAQSSAIGPYSRVGYSIHICARLHRLPGRSLNQCGKQTGRRNQHNVACMHSPQRAHPPRVRGENATTARGTGQRVMTPAVPMRAFYRPTKTRRHIYRLTVSALVPAQSWTAFSGSAHEKGPVSPGHGHGWIQRRPLSPVSGAPTVPRFAWVAPLSSCVRWPDLHHS